MNHIAITPTLPSPIPIPNEQLPVILDFLSSTVKALKIWRQRHQASMQFAHVESHLLQDIGISDAQRFIEVNKPFWEK